MGGHEIGTCDPFREAERRNDTGSEEEDGGATEEGGEGQREGGAVRDGFDRL